MRLGSKDNKFTHGKRKRRLKFSFARFILFVPAYLFAIYTISTQSNLKTESIDVDSLINSFTNDNSGLERSDIGDVPVSKAQKESLEVTKAVTQNDFSNIVYENRKGDAFLTMFGAHRVQSSLQNLPKWLQDYFTWYREQTVPTAKEDTKYLVMTCLDKDICGGLSDRLRALPFFLLAGSVTKRAVCIYWSKPFGLDEFLEPVPGGVDWRCPEYVGKKLNTQRKSRRQPIPYREFGYDRGSPSMVASAEEIFKQLKENDNEKYILVGLFTQDFKRINNLNNIFQAHSYRDKIPELTSWSHVELMGDIFRAMFQPVEIISKQVNATMATLGLKENEFTSVHIRARYPTAKLMNLVRDKDSVVANDKEGGLKFEGPVKRYLVGIATNAVSCANLLAQKHDAPTIFVSSDSNDLVSHLTTNGVKVSDMDSALIPLGLNRTEEILHMEGGNTVAKHVDFFPVIEDLLIMSASKCVAHGIGSFGAFAAGIGGNRCRDIHRNYAGRSETCPNGRANRKSIPIKEGDLLFGQKPGGEGTIEYGEDILINEEKIKSSS